MPYLSTVPGAMPSSLTFLGAARTVTGLALPGRVGWPPCPGRLRHVPGPEGAAAAQLGRPAGAARLDRSGGADPRAPGPRRDAAAAGRPGLQRSHFLHPRHAGPVLAGAPRRRRLQEEEAERANRGGYSRHRPARPLFTEEQAIVTLSRLQPVGYQRPMPVGQPAVSRWSSYPPATCSGAAYVRMRRTDGPGGTVIFGGDLGRYNRPDPAGPVGRHRRPTSCSSSRPTATGCTRSRTRRRPGGDHQRDGAARRQGHHPGVCHRPGGRGALRHQAARGFAAPCGRCRSTSTARWRWRR